MALLISSAVLFLWAHFLSNPSSKGLDKESYPLKAEWNIELPAEESQPLGMVVGRGHETHSLPRTSVSFLDNENLIATFVVRENNGSLSMRQKADASLPLRLRATLLDVRTGTIKLACSWPTDSRFAGIVASNGGKFVAQMGTTLTLFSSSGEALKKLTLPPLEEKSLGWGAHSSPSGRSILFVTTDLTTTSETPWVWVDTDSLQVSHYWKGIRSGWVGISDDTIAMTACSIWFYKCDPHLEIKGLFEDWKVIAVAEPRSQSIPIFVNDETIFLPGHPWKLLLKSGKTLLTGNDPFGGQTAVSSSGGQRFVIPFFKSKGGLAALDIGAHGELQTISVYDAPFLGQSYMLTTVGSTITEQGSEFAVSPDGSMLAILHNRSVSLFRLPLSQAVGKPTTTDK